MKKLNISTQILLVFFVILLIASTSFTIVTMNFSTDIAERELYSRLTTYSFLVKNQNNEIEPDNYNFPDMNVGYIIKYEDNTVYENHLNYYITDETLNDLLNKIDKDNINNLKSYTIKGYYYFEGKKMYYVCQTDDSLKTYSIIFTDSKFISRWVKDVVLKINILFFVIILLSVFVIYLWSNNFVRRIRLIQNHLFNLPKNKYEKKFLDDSLDEIGELSRSVEEMRLEIYDNEKTKQEMLQNISHDFKTPIAVIKSYAEAQLDGMADENSSRVIIAQAELLGKRVNKLLQYNSLEYLSKDKEFEYVDMNVIILELVNSYKYQTNINFELELTDDICFLGYKENWYTVVDNIIDNAKRYAKTKIKIVLKQDRLRIYNDGEHIDETFIKNNFKPYEKGHHGQFGLGMSIVQKTVIFFNYSLKVVNDPIGVSFIIEKIKE